MKRWMRQTETVRMVLFSAVTFALIMAAVLFLERNNQSFKTLLDALWWTVVTITTTGYGDQIPKTTLGKLVGIFTMLFGVVIVSIATGRISSVLVDRKLNERKGLKRLKNLKNHIIICGFKADLKYLIQDILFFETHMTLNDIVVINDLDPEAMTELLIDETLKGIHYLHGDPSEEAVLERANVKSARKALVLSDLSSKEEGESQDAKVLVTVLMLNSLNPSLYICAEVQTVKYKHYLEHMKCDEVVLSEEYTRFLLANATVYSGITKVVSSLLNSGSGDSLKLVHVPAEFINKPYHKVVDHYKKSAGALVIGIVENMGMEREFKQNALSEAQKAPDISTLVKNLQGIHSMERNRTVLNPEDDYVIRKHSGIILISR